MVWVSNSDTVDDVALVTAGSGVSCLVEEDDDWNLVDIPLSRGAMVSASLYVDFMGIQMRFREMNINIPIRPAI